MRKILLFFFLLHIPSLLQAEEIKIKSFSMQMEPMTVPMQRKDNNGNICALVKVILPSPKATFEGNVIGTCDYKTSEYWCYLSPGSKHIKVKFPGYEPLMINFDNLIGGGVKSKQVYEIVLSLPANNGNKSTGSLFAEIKFEELDHSVYHEDQKWRLPSDSITQTALYVNYKGDAFDSKTIFIPEKFFNGSMKIYDIEVPTCVLGKKLFLDNINEGDSLTIVPTSKYYQETKGVVNAAHLYLHLMPLNVKHTRIDIEGVIVDNKTNEPVEGVNIRFYSYFSRNGECVEGSSDANGKFKLCDLLPGYTYSVVFDNVPNGYINPTFYEVDYKVSSDRLKGNEFRFSPNKLEGYIRDKDTNLPIRDVSIHCKSLYSDEPFKTDEKGYFEVAGYKKMEEAITIKAPGYETIQLFIAVDERVLPWEIQYMDQPLIIQMRKTKTPKERRGVYNYDKNRVEYF